MRGRGAEKKKPKMKLFPFRSLVNRHSRACRKSRYIAIFITCHSLDKKVTEESRTREIFLEVFFSSARKSFSSSPNNYDRIGAHSSVSPILWDVYKVGIRDILVQENI